MNDASETWAEHLLRVTEERMEGRLLTESEAAEAHAWAASMAWERETTEEREPSGMGDLFPTFVGGER